MLVRHVNFAAGVLYCLPEQCVYMGKQDPAVGLLLSHLLHTYIAYADAGSDAEEAISDSEEEEVYDTSTDYDSEDEATTDRQSSAATAQQQVSLTHCCHCLNIVHIAGQRLSKKEL